MFITTNTQRLVVGLAIALCSGCFSKPSFSGGGGDDDGVPDAPGDGRDAPPCTLGSWSTLTPISEVMYKVTGEPTITRDRLLLYWSFQEGPSWEIHHAERATPTGTFVVDENPTIEVGGVNIDPDPAITDDGLTVIYRAGNSSTPEIWQATRGSRTDTTWNKMKLTSLASARPESLEVSADGKTVYWAVGGQDLYSATRSTSTSDDFGPTKNIASGIRWPSISGDQLTLYYLKMGTTNDVWQMTRDTASSAFGNPTSVFAGGGKDPDVTSDGTAIVVGDLSSTGISFAERSCL